MSLNIKLKEVFEVEKQYGAFYTGGSVSWTSDGEQILCQNAGRVNIINVDTGDIVKTIGCEEVEGVDEDFVNTFALSDDDEYILTAHKSGLLRLWSKTQGTLIKMWKAIHNGPVSRVCFRARGAVVATGGSDSLIRIWDYEKQTCLSALKGSQGVISVVKFHPNVENQLVFAAGDDNVINCWDYSTRELQNKYSGHFSKVTEISFTPAFNSFVSVSRDKVLILWDLDKAVQLKVIPLYETLESVCVLPNIYKLPNGVDLAAAENKENIYVAIGGESGSVKVWDCLNCKVVFAQEDSSISKASEDGGLAITQLLHCPKKALLAVVSADHNILFHSISTFHCSRQLIGFSDEILDVCFIGKKDRYLAVATNSNDIKFYDTLDMNCQILKGHTDIVLALASHGNTLLSCGKDNTIRLWEVNPGSFAVKCLAKGTKHTSSVTSVAFSKITSTLCASVSEDLCLKVWNIPKQLEIEDSLLSLTCTGTQLAHDKEINCVTIAPNDRIIATASQDKTTKLWTTDNLQLVGVLRGHRRGVWCVRFSPVDQILLTSSADSTLRLWSITEMVCLKTLEGHSSSVLRAEFINKGMEILSAGADGLLKLWNIKTSECINTFEKHEARIWTMVVARDETHFFSGGADSQLIRWKDVTEEKKIAEIQERQELMLQEQELTNLIARKKMLRALKLALKLEKPNLTLKIINTVIKNKESGLEGTVLSLNELHKETLLKHALTWNTNSRHCRPAQLVLNILVTEILANKFKPSGLRKLIEDSLPYTERHFKRTTEFLKDLKFIEFTLKCMQPHAVMEIDEK